MAHDDMNVVIYKILKYIYTCMKRGEEVEPEKISAESLGINESYWAQIINELIENGYVKGLKVINDIGGTMLIKFIDPTITIAGVEYLTQNNFMKKTLKYLQEIKKTVPYI